MDRRAEIEARLAAATPGPWDCGADGAPVEEQVAGYAVMLSRGGPALHVVCAGRTWAEVCAAAEAAGPGVDAGNKFPAITGNGPTSAANAALIAAAPTDLRWLLDELARVDAERDTARTEAARSAAAAVDAARELGHVAAQVTAERDALRAIVDGRDVGPTREEVAAHGLANRWRRFATNGRNIEYEFDGLRGSMLLALLGDIAWSLAPSRWWSLDAEGRPCAWPVTGGAP